MNVFKRLVWDSFKKVNFDFLEVLGLDVDDDELIFDLSKIFEEDEDEEEYLLLNSEVEGSMDG